MTSFALRDRPLAGTITPNRTEVSRNFPVLGFTIRTGKSPSWFEVALANDPRLLGSTGASGRNATNFWTSRELGPLPAEQGEAVFLVPAHVLARFAESTQLYFAVACFASPDRSDPEVWIPDPAAAPSVGISRSFTGERRVALNPQSSADNGYGGSSAERFEWAGDAVVPGIEPVGNGAAANQNGNATAVNGRDGTDAMNSPSNATAQQFVYDDGLDKSFWASHQLMADDDPDAYGIEGPVPAQYETNGVAVAAGAPVRAMSAAEYPQASRFVSAASGNYLPTASPRTIDKIVIHITDGNANINGPIAWFQNPDAKVSSHYIVGQDGEVVQMVRHNDVAYHARGANSHTIGIEHVANTRGLNLTEAQYCASAALVRWLADSIGIPIDRQHILGHREATTTTKSCPGDWDWDYFMGMVTSATCYPRSSHVSTTQSWSAPFGQSIDTQWNDVFLVPQPNGVTCWAAAAAMVYGWKHRVSISPQSIADISGFPSDGGLSVNNHDELARAIGLIPVSPQSYTVEGFRNLLEANGPLWVASGTPAGGHAVVVVGLSGDGTPDGTTVRYHDPLPVGQGTADRTANFAAFMAHYESYASTDSQGNMNIQIMHSGGRPAAQSFGNGQARAQDGGATAAVGSAIVGAVVTRVLDNEGDIIWSLDQMNGKKRPGDVEANEGPPQYQTREIAIPGPKATTVRGVDEIYVDLRIRWEYNGRTVANVAQTVTRANDAVAQGLAVTSTIHNVAEVFPSPGDPNSKAAVRLQINYRFTHVWEEDAIYIRDLTIYGDGTHEATGRWTVSP